MFQTHITKLEKAERPCRLSFKAEKLDQSPLWHDHFCYSEEDQNVSDTFIHPQNGPPKSVWKVGFPVTIEPRYLNDRVSNNESLSRQQYRNFTNVLFTIFFCGRETVFCRKSDRLPLIMCLSPFDGHEPLFQSNTINLPYSGGWLKLDSDRDSPFFKQQFWFQLFFLSV